MASTLAQILSSMRKEPRLRLALPVKIFTQEKSNTPEWSCTYEVSRSGARLKQPQGVEVGQQIWVQRQNRKARFRILWIGQPETEAAGQMGVEGLESKPIWEDEVQGRLL